MHINANLHIHTLSIVLLEVISVIFYSTVNVGEDCPVFDGMYEFCQLSAGGSIGNVIISSNCLSYPLACFVVRKIFVIFPNICVLYPRQDTCASFNFFILRTS